MDRFDEILMEGDKLQEWNSAYVCCIYIKGDKKDCNNYRGLSIINYIERVFSKVKEQNKEYDKSKDVRRMGRISKREVLFR